LQIPAIIPEIWPVIIPGIVVTAISSLFAVIILTYGIDIIRGTRAVAPRTAFWPPLWWWFGLGVFALDELAARSLLHRLSSCGGVVVELSRGMKVMVVSADLYGMYLCRLGREGGVCDDVEWVRYGEVRFKVSKVIRIIKRSDWHVVGRFIRKVVLPILAGVLVFFMIKYMDLLTILTFLLFLILFLFVCHKYNDFRELKEYIQAIKIVHLMSHIFWAFILLFIFAFLTSDPVVSIHIFFIAAITSFLSRADPELSRYLFPGLELRLMYVDGSVIGLARGGCLQWAKVGVAPQVSALVIRDGDCLVVVSPYVDNVRSRLQRYLCGPACPPVRVVGGEGVAVGVLDLQKRRYYYYVVDSSR
jgi:hypothetical protein